MKNFSNFYLMELIGKYIKTEEDTKKFLGGEVVADVLYKNTVYEAETFFSQDIEGMKPTEKINYTINKYNNKDNYDFRIKLIFGNFTLLRHLNTIISSRNQKSEE